MSLRVPFSKMGVQFSHDFSSHYHRNIEYCVRISIATHSYPTFAGQLLFANSSGRSSLTLTIVSIGILPTPPDCSLSLLFDLLFPLPLIDHYPDSTRKHYHYYSIYLFFFRKTVETRKVSDTISHKQITPPNFLQMKQSEVLFFSCTCIYNHHLKRFNFSRQKQ